MNLLENIKILLEESQPYIDTPEENDKGTLILPVKNEVAANPDAFVPFYRMFIPLQRKLGLEPYIKMVSDTKPMKIGNTTVEMCTKLKFQVDIAELHRDRLAVFFHHNITQDQVIESINFLFGCHWTEEQFLREISISKITLYRYRSGKLQRKPKKDLTTETPK